MFSRQMASPSEATGGLWQFYCVEAMMTVYKFAWIEFEAVYYTLPTYIHIYIYRDVYIRTYIYDI